ncbi:MAG: hypothetical protein AAF725_03505, partial [Acidobacteriota bacterium]
AAALLGAGERLEHQEALAGARELTAALLDRGEERRRFTFASGLLSNRRQAPGLLRGLAGVGWHLLRTGGVDLPDLLALELPPRARSLSSHAAEAESPSLAEVRP